MLVDSKTYGFESLNLLLFTSATHIRWEGRSKIREHPLKNLFKESPFSRK